jgi:hypothetical protein
MDPDQYLKAIERECAEFTVALQNGADRDVPSCPCWRVADLAMHLGVIQRWATEMVRSRASEPLRGREQLFGVDPDDPALVEWFEQGTRELVGVLRSSPRILRFGPGLQNGASGSGLDDRHTRRQSIDGMRRTRSERKYRRRSTPRSPPTGSTNG